DRAKEVLMSDDVASMYTCGSRWRLRVAPQGRTRPAPQPAMPPPPLASPVASLWPNLVAGVGALLLGLQTCCRRCPTNAPLVRSTQVHYYEGSGPPCVRGRLSSPPPSDLREGLLTESVHFWRCVLRVQRPRPTAYHPTIEEAPHVVASDSQHRTTGSGRQEVQ